MTEINLRLYISIFPRNCTEALVTVENFMQTILMRTFHFSAKDLWQNSALFLTASEMLGRRIKGKRRVRDA
uniref:Uncharacterized protein n=1 Tax=Strix occidentalis caurina TaxID=311401 RepID=A0A8D0EEM4_STROC